MNLEKRFVVGLFVLLALSCAAIYGLALRRTSLLTAVLLSGASVGLIASGLAHQLLFKPLRRLVVMGKAIGSGDLSKRMNLAPRSELGSLACEMDSMCDRLVAAKDAADVHMEAVYQLRHSDRISTLGRLASSVAHELGNPLNVIELRAQLITSGGSTNLQQAQQNAAVIVEQTRRMTHIIDEILSFARAQPARIRQLDLVDVLRKAVALSAHASHKHRTRMRVDLPASAIALDGDADKLLQVFVNLLMNAVEAMPDGGTLTLSTGDELRAPLEEPDGAARAYVRVDIADRGVGITAEHIGKVFDAFFSTKSAQGGTGLGLCIAQGIAHEHAGWISADSEVGHGSTFRVYLPTRQPAGDDHAQC